MTEQQTAFWDTIKVFEEGLLPYVMVIGLWAEYIYQHYYISGVVKVSEPEIYVLQKLFINSNFAHKF